MIDNYMNFKNWLNLQEKKLTKNQRKRLIFVSKDRPSSISKTRIYT